MPKLKPNAVPWYRLHKQSGQAIVTLSGKDILLGGHGTAASQTEYQRRIAEWLSNDRRMPEATGDFTVTELIAAFKAHAESYYRHADGSQTSEVHNFRVAFRPLRKIYGATRSADFGPLKLETVRDEMIKMGWCRSSINHHIARIKHLFKWAVSRELVPASVHHALVTLAGLRFGRSAARESEPVKPIPDNVVEATLVELSPTIKAMVQLQRLTGARPSEICSMRIGGIDRRSPIWTYSPATHKTSHHGLRRIVPIGPRAQVILQPFLTKIDPAEYVFSPKDAEADRRTVAHEQRQTPLRYGNRPGTNRKRRPKRGPGDHYDVAAYRRAIRRATELAFPPPESLARRKIKGKKGIRWETPTEWCQRLGQEGWKELRVWQRQHSWHPHQLRHTAATAIRRQFGIEAAQHVLGHATINVTELYAEKHADIARQIAAAVG